MRLAALLCLGLMGCDALAERPSSDHEPSPDQVPTSSAGRGGGTSGGGSAAVAGSIAIVVPTLDVGGSATFEPEPEPDWCETAEQNGATFCEAHPQSLEYCEPAPEDGQGCIAYGDDDVPGWAYWLVLECYAHCGVGMRASERVLEGSCCYTVVSEIYGR